ncbi:MAG: nucleoside triphosphate pyrophosphohydrolase [Acidobacteria bacterium]|nr:nucleoside triphosphate pyrophosphohydrolase [Acidobacteriota bacterium]MBI3664178.1 nucleoside triphosphate pyrophosphohydrolase [Acidobacteriota bacterium]
MTAGECFEALVKIQERLLAPGGCPWDREQTHDSLRTYLIEETYEVLETLEARDFKRLPGELGDLLLQIVFHAQLARQEGHFDIRDVIERIHTKMVRRHPHVFGDARAANSKDVLKHWEQIKAEERAAGHEGSAAPAGKNSILEGVSSTLPALLEAYQLTRRAANIGFDWADVEGILEKLKEETGELREHLGTQRTASGRHSGRPTGRPYKSADAAMRNAETQERVEEEVGDLLFVAVNLSRFLNVDPEIALKKANRKFTSRFRAMEQEVSRRGGRLADVTREEMEALWERSKRTA